MGFPRGWWCGWGPVRKASVAACLTPRAVFCLNFVHVCVLWGVPGGGVLCLVGWCVVGVGVLWWGLGAKDSKYEFADYKDHLAEKYLGKKTNSMV